MKYVIVGNSAAGIGGVEGIRSVDRSGEIVMFTDEPYHTYSRPLISYYLQGKTDIEKMSYRPEGFYCDNNVRLERGVKVAAIDAENRRVVITNCCWPRVLARRHPRSTALKTPPCFFIS